MNKDPDFLNKIDPWQFEELIAASYKEAKFDEVILTPRSGDHGRDVIAIRNGYIGVKVVESVKRYSPNRLVTAEDVRALLHVMNDDRSVTHGFVTTSSDFAPRIATDPGIAPYLQHRLRLINGTELKSRLASLLEP